MLCEFPSKTKAPSNVIKHFLLSDPTFSQERESVVNTSPRKLPQADALQHNGR